MTVREGVVDCSNKKTLTKGNKISVSVDIVVARDGIEPPTQGFSVLLATNLLTSLSLII